MGGELFGIATSRRHQVDVEISVSLARESNPLPVGRESSINISRPVDRQALNVLAILISGPDVSEIGEDDPAVVIMGIAHQPRFAAKCGNHCEKKQCCGKESGCLFHGS